jgi:hypothetical protein
VCKNTTEVEWVGKPREKHSGGEEHGSLRRRRGNSGY